MKRYVIKDEEGKVVEVSELEENEKAPEVAPEKKDEEGAAAAPFTPEQMDAIRKIISEELAKAKEQPAEAGEPGVGDEDEMKKEEEEKKLAAEDSKKQAKDSKTGPAAVSEQKQVNDSASIDLEEERNNAWTKRYGLK